MRRRPEEGDRDQHQRRDREVPHHRGPADGRRQRSRQSTDDDVLRRAALEPERVHEHVEEDGEGEQRRSKRVHEQAHHCDGGNRDPPAEHERVLAGNVPERNGTGRGPRHPRVDIGIVRHVEGTRGAGAECDAQQGRERHQRMHVPRRHRDSGKPSEHHQRHHPRLEQREEIADRRRARLCPEDGGCYHQLMHSAHRDARQLVVGVERRRRRQRPLQRRGARAPRIVAGKPLAQERFRHADQEHDQAGC